jgi:hypothetical protein
MEAAPPCLVPFVFVFHVLDASIFIACAMFAEAGTRHRKDRMRRMEERNFRRRSSARGFARSRLLCSAASHLKPPTWT